MLQVTFKDIKLNVVGHSDHIFLLSSKDVALGYGVSEHTIRSHRKDQSDELIEGKHFIIDRSYKNTPKTYWTKRGIVRLGFFIKSQQAKAFRDWAEDYVVEEKKTDTRQLERENVELKRALNRLLKQPTPTCEELLKLHYPVLHNNMLELDNTFKHIDIDALNRFVFFISQVQKNVATLAQGLKQDRKKRT